MSNSHLEQNVTDNDLTIFMAFLTRTLILTLCFSYTVSGTILPEGHTVFEGDTVEFHCEVDDYGTLNDIDWVFTWAGDNVGLYIEAETTGIVGPSTSAFLKEDHGIYRTFYNRIETDFGRTHNCTLRIENVQKGDEGKYNCAYYRRSGAIDYYEHITTTSARLRVLVPPSVGNPKCDYLTTPSNLTEETWHGAHAKLMCTSSGGDPPAMLSWYSNGDEIGSGKELLNSVEYEMSDKDNGREFLCVATSPALKELRNCSVIPFQIPLSIELEGSSDLVKVGESVRYTCRGHGLPRIDAYSWYVGDDQATELNTQNRYNVEDMKDGSALTILNLKSADNSSTVTCRIRNPHGLSAAASAKIKVLQTNTGSMSTQVLSLTIGLIAGLLMFTFLVVIGIFRYREKRKRHRMVKTTDFQEVPLNEYERIGSTKSCKYEVNCNGTSPNQEEVTYANQTSKNLDEKDRLILPSSTAYEVVQPKNTKKTAKPHTNVEGLEYADLELPSPVDDTVILNPSADEMVMYSEFTASVN